MEQLKQLLTAAGIAYKENEPLAAHCTFKIGGPARLFVQPTDRAQLCRAVALCKVQGVRYYLLGNGSNILFADEGYNGAVLDVSSMQDAVEVHGTQLTAGAGVRLSALCKTALEHGLTGLEFAYGIPGTVGGAVYMNAGAYGGEMKDVLTTVQYLTAEGEVKESAASELDLRYRHSIFEENGGCILSAQFALTPGEPEAIRAKMDELMAKRLDKQPYLLFAAVSDKDYRDMEAQLSAGIPWKCIGVVHINSDRGISSEILAKEFEETAGCPVIPFEDTRTAVRDMRKRSRDGVLFCVGSLYLIGEIKAVLNEIGVEHT